MQNGHDQGEIECIARSL